MTCSADHDTATVSFTFDGQVYAGKTGETLAAALLRAGVVALGSAEDADSNRGAFCWMGWCQECRVLHEGRMTEACRLDLTDGLVAQSRGPRVAN
jgi:hypothetical protein